MILRLKTYNLETILTVCTFAALLWCDHAMASQPVFFFFFFLSRGMQQSHLLIQKMKLQPHNFSKFIGFKYVKDSCKRFLR